MARKTVQGSTYGPPEGSAAFIISIDLKAMGGSRAEAAQLPCQRSELWARSP